MNDSSYCKTFAFAVASDKASEWTSLAKKWGVPVPVNGFGYADYTALKVDLARFALLMDEPPGAKVWQDSNEVKWMIWDYESESE